MQVVVGCINKKWILVEIICICIVVLYYGEGDCWSVIIVYNFIFIVLDDIIGYCG